METIAICAAFHDAAPRILEWIAFHRLVGVDRFVLYDLGSTDGTAGLIACSRFGHQATVIPWAHGEGRASPHGDFVANHASRFTWAAFLALEEFLHPLASDTIRALLPRYDGFSAVLLRRVAFATPGPQNRPGQFVIGHYTTRAPDDSPLHSAAPTLLRTADFHRVNAAQPGFALTGAMCNARGEAVPADQPDAQGSDDVMVVNCYPATPTGEGRSRFATSHLFAAAPSAGANADQRVNAADATATVQDRRIVRFIPGLRAMLHDVSRTAPPRPASPISAPPPAPPPTARPASAQLLLGIGIISYNRRSVLSETLDRVQQHTRHPRTIVAVADDGSTDGTLDMLRARQVLTVTGRNMSIAWNKNRALFLLSELLRCDVVVLLEDDAYPVRDNWESEWMDAAVRWGHANVAGQTAPEHFVGGAGTVDDPIHSQRITAHCACFSREAVLFGGYFDTRFREYGHEHVEHTRRLLRMGYGGIEGPVGGHSGPLFKLLWGGIDYHAVPSVIPAKEAQAERNRELAQMLFGDFSYRAPWRNEDEARQLREEMRHSFPRAVL